MVSTTAKNNQQSAAMKSSEQKTQQRSGRCMRPGPVGRNPYLNFLREFRKKNCGFSAVETVKMGAKAWNSLSQEKKLQYIAEAFYAPLRRRRMSAAYCPKVVCPTMPSSRGRKSRRMTSRSSHAKMSRSSKQSERKSRPRSRQQSTEISGKESSTQTRPRSRSQSRAQSRSRMTC